MRVYNPGGGTGTGGSFPNSEVLEKIQVDSYGRLYYAIAENLDHLKESCVLVMLGSLNDESGYNNIITPAPDQENPLQVAGIDSKPALALQTNKTELLIPNIPSLLSETGATLYCVYSTYSSYGITGLINTIDDSYWDLGGSGYNGVFRSAKLQQYPPNLAINGNFLWSIHSRTNDFEIFVNNQTKGVQGGAFYKGNYFKICRRGAWNDGYLSMLLVVPFWVDKTSSFHLRKMQAIKARFPSLPFVL